MVLTFLLVILVAGKVGRTCREVRRPGIVPTGLGNRNQGEGGGLGIKVVFICHLDIQEDPVSCAETKFLLQPLLGWTKYKSLSLEFLITLDPSPFYFESVSKIPSYSGST